MSSKKRKELRNYLLGSTYITFSEKRQSFVYGKKRLKGLVPCIKKAFYEDYEYIQSKYRVVGDSGLKKPSDGIKRGKLVHNQLCEYGNKENNKTFAENNPILHVYTKRAIDFLKKYNLKPIISEYPISDSDFKIGTAVDMIAMDENGKIILIEWKSGMNTYFKRGNVSMNGPLSDRSNSPLNQALLQLLFTSILFEQTTSIKPDDAIVVHINEESIDHYYIPKKLYNQKLELFHYLVDNNFFVREIKLDEEEEEQKINELTSNEVNQLVKSTKFTPEQLDEALKIYVQSKFSKSKQKTSSKKPKSSIKKKKTKSSNSKKRSKQKQTIIKKKMTQSKLF